jgi:predicted  nucleic acid-binding Zn-ribbon protein
MKYLTFLDYTALEARGKSIEANLQEKDREIEELRHNDKVKEDALATLSDQVMKLMVEVQELKRRK